MYLFFDAIPKMLNIIKIIGIFKIIYYHIISIINQKINKLPNFIFLSLKIMLNKKNYSKQ